ncbi:MAG: hypothetical protein KC609_06840 [Myxococcales bacterium]|nr:hypothetical protein [Myxococcales bacterium]
MSTRLFILTFACLLRAPFVHAAPAGDPRLRTPGCHVADRAGRVLLCVARTQPLFGALTLTYIVFRFVNLTRGSATGGVRFVVRQRVVPEREAASLLRSLPRRGNGVRELRGAPTSHGAQYRAQTHSGRTLELRIEVTPSGLVSLTFRRASGSTGHYWFPSTTILSHHRGSIQGTLRHVGTYFLRVAGVVALQFVESRWDQLAGGKPRLIEQRCDVRFYTLDGTELGRAP